MTAPRRVRRCHRETFAVAAITLEFRRASHRSRRNGISVDLSFLNPVATVHNKKAARMGAAFFDVAIVVLVAIAALPAEAVAALIASAEAAAVSTAALFPRASFIHIERTTVEILTV